jgi:hypothetical protein
MLRVILLSQLIVLTQLMAQAVHTDRYCVNAEATKIDALKDEFLPDSLYVSYRESAEGLVLRVVNTKKRPMYLFSSYFSDVFHSSRYLHRVNKENKSYNISFLPLIPYLSTTLNDRRVIGENKLVVKDQNLYDFIKMSPWSYFDIEIKFEKLFKDIGRKDNIVGEFRTETKSKAGQIKFKYLSVNKLKGKYNLFFDLAVYDQVDLLCEESAYFYKEFEFDKQAKSFHIVRVAVSIKNFNHPLFRNP